MTTIARRFAGDEQRTGLQAHLSAMVEAHGGTPPDWTPPPAEPVAPDWTPAPASTPPRKKQTNATRRADRRARVEETKARNAQRDKARAVQLEKWAHDSGLDRETPITLKLSPALGGPLVIKTKKLPLRVVPQWVQQRILAINADPSGKVARHTLHELPDVVLAGSARQLCYEKMERQREDPRGLYANPFVHLRCRRYVALAFFWSAMRERQREHGRWVWHVDGVTNDYMRWLNRDPEYHYPPGCFQREATAADRRPERRANGVPCGTDWTGRRKAGGVDGECGMVEAFRLCGAVYTPHNGKGGKYVTFTGFQPNDYMLRSDVIEDHHLWSDDAARVLALIEWELAERLDAEEREPELRRRRQARERARDRAPPSALS